MELKSARDIWESALGELQVQVSKSNYKTWFEKTTGLDYQNDQFTVGVPNTFIAEYLDKNQRSIVEKTLIGILRKDVKLVFRVNGIDQSRPGFAGIADVPVLNTNFTFKD